MSMKDEVEKLSPKTGDVLVFHVGGDEDEIQEKFSRIVEFQRLLFSRGLEVGCVVLRHGESIRMLEESDMAKLGWVRDVRPDAIVG